MNPTEPDPINPSDAAHSRGEGLAGLRGTSKDERWFRSLVQNSSDITMILELNGTVRYVNPAIERVLGYRPEDFVGTRALDYVHPEDLKYMSESFAETLQKPGVHPPVEYRVRAADGTWRNMEAIRSNWLDDPNVAGLVANIRDVTQRKRAKEAIERLSRQNQLILDSAGEGIYGLDAEGRTTFVNPAAAALTGYDPEDLIGKDQHHVIHHSRDDGTPYPEEECPILVTLRDGEVRRVDDEVFWRKDGTSFPVEYTSTPIREYGEVTGVVVTFTDITERKKVEEALKEREHYLRTVVGNVPVVLSALDREGVFTLSEGKSLEALGLRPGELVGQSIFENYGDVPGLSEHVRRALGGEEFVATIEVGEAVFEVFFSPLRDERADVVGLISVSTDITERKKAEETLKESEERFRSTFDEAAIGMAVNKLDGRFLQVNSSLCQMLGYSEEELLATTFQDITHPDDLDISVGQVQRLLEGALGGYQLEKRYLHAEGYPVWVSLSVSLVKDSENRPLYLIAQMQDITERKEAEGEKARQARHAALRTDISAILARGTFDEHGTLHGILQRCMECMVQHLNAAFARIWTLDEEEKMLELQASAGMYTHLDGPHGRVPVGEYKIGLIAQERAPHLTNEVLNDPRVSDKGWAEREGMVAFAGYPLIVEGRLVGVMAMFALKPLEEDAIEVLASVADAIAQGIERKRTEEALRRSESSLAAAQRIAHLGNWDYHITNDQARWSEEMYRIFGFAPRRFVPRYRTFLNSVHPDDRDLIRRSVRKALYEEEQGSVDYRVVRPDGEVRVVQSRYGVVRDVSGRAVKLTGTVHDITERKKTEEVLKESEERFRSLIQNASDVITLLEADGTIRYQSPSVERMLGYRPEELVGENAFDYVHPEDLERVLGAFADGLQDPGFRPREEYRFRHKDGSWRYLESIGSNLIGDAKVGKFVVNSRDITERKRAEEEIRQANQRLAELAVLRADFTAMVAHELDTPLAVIRGYADVLATGELGSAEQERALSQIQAETEVLNALVEDVRLAASAERRDFVVDPREVPVGELLDDGARFAATLPGDHPLLVEGAADVPAWDGVRAGDANPFIFEGGAQGQRVWADRYRIGQVLRNLLTNAVKYSPEGSPIELRAVPDEAAGRVRIEVIDHGPGIHPDDVERIFEKFGRGRDTSGRKVTGVGLGLYLSRRILQVHGSELTFDSTPGGGSVFGFELEAADA